jgi:uncharacterized protein (TIGR02996 family)
MTEQQALLAAILATPQDDLPRVVYADWLDEHGQPERAEFIRVQIELAKYAPNSAAVLYHAQQFRNGHKCETGELGLCTWCRLEKAERRLWQGGLQDGFREAMPAAASHPYWCAHRPADGNLGNNLAIVVRRGFVAEVRCPLADWVGGNCPACVLHPTNQFRRNRRGNGSPWEPCEKCGGTAERPGIGPAVVAAHPVERVVLSDREPVEYLDILNVPLGWSWSRSHTMAGAATVGPRVNTLPAAVFDLLPTPKRHPSQAYHDSPDRDAAVDAASAALIAWAKSQPHPARITSTPLSVDLTAARLPFTYAANPDADVTFGFATSD